MQWPVVSGMTRIVAIDYGSRPRQSCHGARRNQAPGGAPQDQPVVESLVAPPEAIRQAAICEQAVVKRVKSAVT